MALPTALTQNQNMQNIPGLGKLAQVPRYTPQQQNVLNSLLQRGLSGIESSSFEPIEQRARQQFQTQTIPSLAERFTSAGGGQRSSAFQGALGQAGADLESQLAAYRSQFGNQQGLQLLGLGLQPQFENILQPENQGFLSSLLGSAGQGLGSLGTLYGANQLGLLGGGAGAATGATQAAGGGLSSLLGGAGGATAAAGAAAPYLLPILAALGLGYGIYNAYQD